MPTSLNRVKGIGPATAEKLEAAGLKSAEALAAATPEQLADVSGFGNLRAKQVIGHARQLVTEAVPDSAERSGANPSSGKKKAAKSKQGKSSKKRGAEKKNEKKKGKPRKLKKEKAKADKVKKDKGKKSGKKKKAKKKKK
jgi:nucleotidyltransferase/DNA polymerase involved in DNA repair